jgi:iron complex transport system ATP-binding protein
MVSGKLLELSDYCLDLNGKSLLKGLSFNIDQSEVVALVGPNGSGKSTLLRAITGILSGSGRLFLDNRSLDSYRPREVAQKVAYVPQEFKGNFPISVMEFMRTSLYPIAVECRGREEQVIEQALMVTDVCNLANRSLLSLSGGERQRVLLASALSTNPRLMLLDEPTTFLDPKHKREFYCYLRKLAEESSIAFIIVSHDLNEVASFCGRFLALSKGSIFFDGKPSDFMQQKVLRDLFQTDFALREEEHQPSYILPG